MDWKIGLISHVEKIRDNYVKELDLNICNTQWLYQLLSYLSDINKSISVDNKTFIEISNIIIRKYIGNIVDTSIIDFIITNFNDEDNFLSDETLKAFSSLQYLQWPQFYKNQYITALTKIINTKLLTYCNTGEYDQSYLYDIYKWKQDILFPYISELFGNQYLNYQALYEELVWITIDLYAKHRSNELFEMIAGIMSKELLVLLLIVLIRLITSILYTSIYIDIVYNNIYMYIRLS